MRLSSPVVSDRHSHQIAQVPYICTYKHTNWYWMHCCQEWIWSFPFWVNFCNGEAVGIVHFTGHTPDWYVHRYPAWILAFAAFSLKCSYTPQDMRPVQQRWIFVSQSWSLYLTCAFDSKGCTSNWWLLLCMVGFGATWLTNAALESRPQTPNFSSVEDVGVGPEIITHAKSIQPPILCHCISCTQSGVYCCCLRVKAENRGFKFILYIRPLICRHQLWLNQTGTQQLT